MRMSCTSVRRHSDEYLDGDLHADARQRIAGHLRECDSCSSYFEQTSSARSALKSLPVQLIPAHLATSLRVIASRERALIESTRGSRFQAVWERWRLKWENLMRPVAIPATGGLLSSMLLFGTLVFSLGTTVRTVAYEVPIVYHSDQQREPNLVPVELRSKAVILNISFDSNGHIIDRDYAVMDGEGEVRRNLPRTHSRSGDIAIPAMPNVLALAQPITGDIRIEFTPLGLRP